MLALWVARRRPNDDDDDTLLSVLARNLGDLRSSPREPFAAAAAADGLEGGARVCVCLGGGQRFPSLAPAEPKAELPGLAGEGRELRPL